MIGEKTVTAIILVAGNSTRYGQNRNKNFEMINEKTVMAYSLEAFDKNEYIDDIIIGAKEEEIAIIEEITKNEGTSKQTKIVLGGSTRQETVHNCIKNTDSDVVIIHDGARPAIKQEFINNCIESMSEFKGVTVGVPSKDTIKITDDNGIVIQSTKRSNTWIIQTPQCFDRKTLLDLHEKFKKQEVTDDCMLLEMNGENVKIFKGDYTNLKITTYEDIDIMRFNMKS